MSVNAKSLANFSSNNTFNNLTVTGPINTNGQNFNFPSVQGSADSFLRNDGTGNSSWNRLYTNTLVDMNPSGAVQGELLRYNGTQWVNSGSSNDYIKLNGRNLIFPSTIGTSGNALLTDGAGNLSWGKPSLTIYDIGNLSVVSSSIGDFLRFDGSNYSHYPLSQSDVGLSNLYSLSGTKIGINTSNPGKTLEIQDVDTVEWLRDTNSSIGSFIQNTYDAGFLGVYNSLGSSVNAIQGNHSRAVLAWDSYGKIGSVTNDYNHNSTTNNGSPIFRNLLDDNTGSAILQDIAPSTNWTLISINSQSISGIAACIAEQNGIIFTEGTTALNIWNYENAYSPTLITNSINEASINQMIPKGNYLYVLTTSRFRIYDITYFRNTTLKGSFSSGGKSMHIYGRYAIIVNTSSPYFQIYDIGDVNNIVSVYSTDTFGASSYMMMYGRYVVLSTGTNVKIIDLTNVLAPSLAGVYNAGVTVTGITMNDTIVILASSGLITAINIANLSSIVSLSSISITGVPKRIIQSGRYLYFVTSSDLLYVIDKYDYNALSIRASFSTQSSIVDLAINGKYAYLRYGSGIQVINLRGGELSNLIVSSLQVGQLTVSQDISSTGDISAQNANLLGLNITDGTSLHDTEILGQLSIKTLTNTSLGFEVRDSSDVSIFSIDTSGQQTQTKKINITNTTNQIVLGTTNTTTLSFPAPTGNISFTFPSIYGTNGQFLQTNGSGTLSWQTVSSPALSTLTDVTLTGLASGNFLRYNGSTWVNYVLTKSDVGLSNVDNVSNATLLNNTSLTGNTTIQNLNVTGTLTSLNTTNTTIQDNLITLNSGELGAGVSAGQAGILVDRGSSTMYEIAFDEPSLTFRIGQVGSLQAVATREDSPSDGYIPVWDNATNKFITSTGISSSIVTQLKNIGASSISGTQWGYLAAFNQGLATTNGPTFTSLTVSNTSNQLVLNNGNTTTLHAGAIGAPVIITLPTSTDTLVGRTTTDTLTNKSLNNSSVFMVDNTTPSKRINFDSSNASNNTTLSLASAVTTNRTITFPDVTDTVVTLTATQTLSNKTLSGAFTATGNSLFQTSSNSATAFQVKTSGGSSTLFTIDTLNAKVQTLNHTLDNSNGYMIPATLAFSISKLNYNSPTVVSFVAPTGSTSMTYKLWGAGGGERGGSGGYVTVTQNITAGDTYYITIGGAGGFTSANSGTASGGSTGSANDNAKGGVGKNGASAGGNGGYSGGGGQATVLHKFAAATYTLQALAGGGGGGIEFSGNFCGGGAGNNAPNAGGNALGLAGSNGAGGAAVSAGSGQFTNAGLAYVSSVAALSSANGTGGDARIIFNGNERSGGGGGGYGGGSAGSNNGGGGGGNYIPSVIGNVTTSSGSNGNNGNGTNTSPPNISDTDYIAVGGSYGYGGGHGGVGGGGLAIIILNFYYTAATNSSGSLDYKFGSTTLLTLNQGSLTTPNMILDDGSGNISATSFKAKNSGFTAALTSGSLGSNIVLTLPTVTDNLVGRTTTDTLTNKTLTTPSISQIINTGTLTLPTATDTLVGRTTTDTLTNKTLTLPTISQINNGGTINIPSGADTLVTLTATQTLTNKSLNNTNVFHVDTTDNTKKVGFQSSGATTATTLTIASQTTTNKTITFPDITDTLVTLTATQTLTNKTLTLPTISQINNGGTINIPSGADTFVTLTATQTLTNKTLTTPTIAQINNGANVFKLPTSNGSNIQYLQTDGSGNTSWSTIAGSGTIGAVKYMAHARMVKALTNNSSSTAMILRSTIDFGSQYLSGNPNSDALYYDTFTIPTGYDGIWTFRIGGWRCGQGSGLTRMTVTRVSTIMYDQRRIAPNVDCTVYDSNFTWNGFQAGDLVTFQINENNTGAFPSSVTDASIDIPHGELSAYWYSSNALWQSSSYLSANTTTYNTGTASQSANTITGSGTTFTTAMIGGLIVFTATNKYALITGFTSTTSLTVDTSQTVSSDTYTIFYNGIQMSSNGNASFAGTVNTNNGYLSIEQTGTQSISANTITNIQWPTINTNTFGSALTISGTNNTTFTNTSGRPMKLNVSAMVPIAASGNPSFSLWMYLAHSIGGVPKNYGTASAGTAQLVSYPILLANNDFFTITMVTNVGNTLGPSGLAQSQAGTALNQIMLISQIA